jgi:tetratricopeptide (TPR) repeat protein
LALETEIAQQIAHSLTIELIPNYPTIAARKSTRDSKAYEAFLKATYLFNKGTPEALKESVSYFQEAIRADPGFTLAYAGLADSYNLLGSYLVLPPKEAFPEAEKAAHKALELDGNSAEAHNALALAGFYYDWNWADAENHFKRAIALNPGYSRAHHWYAWYLSLLGRHTAALAEVRTAQELDPLSPQLNTDIGWFYYRARRYDEAIAQFKRTLQLEPGFIQGHVGLARAYLQKGMYSEASTQMREALSRSGASAEEIAALAHSDPIVGIRNLRRVTLERLKKDKTQSPAVAYAYAELYVLLGENDRALMWLDKAYAEHSYTLVFLKVEPAFDPLRSEPRFQSLLRRVGFTQ